MAKQSQPDNKKDEKKVVTPIEQMQSYLENNKKYFYNDVEEPAYIISSGSLKLDIQMGGGLRPGVIRLTGVTEGGKTNCALSFARNFLATVDNSYVIYFRAEGRLTNEILIRQGLLNHERFQVVKGNVYEKIIAFIGDLINKNPTGAKYLFVIDSADAMIPLGDIDKGPEEANKVSGGAVLTSDMLRRMANKFIAFGHVCIIISQKRDQVAIDKYAPKDPRVTNASGGNALLHYSDWILEFQHRYFGDLIKTSDDKDADIVGHNCKIIFRKSPNEKSFNKVEYPIRYGRENGKSIWVEREIVDMLIAFGMLVKTSEKSAWMSMVEPERVLMKEKGLEFPEKIQGSEQTVEFLEQNPKITEYLYQRLCTNLGK
jgi:RecA/RadA recombinase